ncbi:MAG: tRNA (adenosine(37)-N6)-threonylcarbamoyltransferase complex transferase subunit TsaD, partial [Microgenomates group bacterium]
MIILSIDTSCDETSVAVTEGRRVLSNVIYSQVVIHKQWGGVVPSLAKRAHQERIDFV